MKKNSPTTTPIAYELGIFTKKFNLTIPSIYNTRK